MERQNDRRKNNFDRKNDRSAQKPGRRPEKAGHADRSAERSFEKPRREERPDWQEESMQNLVYGKNAVTELLKNGAGTDTVFLAEGLAPSVAAYYTALAKEAGAAVKRVHTAKLKSLTGTESHQGVAAFASAVEYASLEDILALAAQRQEDPFVLLCDGVEDPHNLGAMIRTALLAGAHGIVIPKRGGAQVTGVVAKTSAGASMELPIARVANIGEAVRRLKEANLFVYAADMSGETATRQNLTGPIAIVMGSEGRGVSPLVKKLCDGCVSLPQSNYRGSVDSLNVSVAAGVLMYEIVRQRADKGGANK